MVPPVLRLAPAEALRADDELCDLIDTLHITTPAWHGATTPRFRGDLHVMSQEHWQELTHAGEALLEVLDELFQRLQAQPEWLERHFSMPPSWVHMSTGGAQWWNLFARLDVFHTVDGRWQICEINSDTPSGQTDMWALIEAYGGDETPWGTIPGADYEGRFVRLLQQLTPQRGKAATPPVLAIIYPTDIPEDLDLIAAYRRMGEAGGFDVVLGGPTNLRIEVDGSVSLFGRRVDVMLRHYKTDWWGERRRSRYDMPPIWDAEPFEVLGGLLDADAAGRVAIINPFASMPTQSKKAFAFLWEQLESFSEKSQQTIRAYVPKTYRFSGFEFETLLREQKRWVLKSDFGCEGEEVVVGANVSADHWRRSLKLAIPDRWVVQEFFEIQPLADGALPNIGLYTVAGKSAGLYGRVNKAQKITDMNAVVLPVVIERGEERA